ncbi:MAG: type IV secretory system conjugative DNA transfer family protein, partial [Ktedonobacteraceae bacterium]
IMALSEHGWPSGLFNLLDEITTQKRKTQKAAGIGFELDFSVRLTWQAIDEHTSKVKVNVKERQGNANRKACGQECFDLIKGMHERAAGFLESLAHEPPRTTYGDARWATDQDLGASSYLHDQLEPSQLLLGPHSQKKFVALPADETEKHSMVCGPTGCGKTSTLFVPNLIMRTGWSTIVTEATAGSVESDDPEELASEAPDLMDKTAGYRQQMGHKIYYFNPDDLRSDCINPITGITTIRQAGRLANLLIRNTNIRVDASGDPFWEQAETALLTSLVMHTAVANGDLGMTRQLLRLGPKGLADLLQNSPAKEARLRYQEFVGWSTEATRNSIVIGLMQRLELWTQPRIVALTSKNDIDWEALKDELFSFYLAVPADKPELKPCAAIMFAYLINFVCAKKLKHRVSLYLDEFTNFGYIPDFPNRLSIIRHRHVPAMLGLQDYAQAEEIYKTTASTLFSQPGTRIFFKPQTLGQAKIISETLGIETRYERSVSSSCQITEKEFGKELLTPGAVQMLEKGHAIVLTPSSPPLKLKRFQPHEFDYATKIKLPPRRLLKVDDSLVRVCEETKELPAWTGYGAEAKGADERVKTKALAEPQQEKIVQERQKEKESQPEKEPEKKKSERSYNEYGDRMPRF